MAAPAWCWPSWCLPILAVMPASFNQASFIAPAAARLFGTLVRRLLRRRRVASALVNRLQVAVIATIDRGRAGDSCGASACAARQAGWRSRPYGPVPGADDRAGHRHRASRVYRSALDVGLSGTPWAWASATPCWLCLSSSSMSASSLRGDRRQLAARRVGLGAGPWTVFRTVTLPNITPGLVGGGDLLLHHLVRRSRGRRLPCRLFQQDPAGEDVGVDPPRIYAGRRGGCDR